MAAHHSYSSRSYGILRKCESVLTDFSERTLYYNETDLSVSKHSVRSLRMQQHFVDIGVSKTMNSAHLPNENGKSRAVDLNIYIPGINPWMLANGKLQDMYIDLHIAAQKAARELDLNIRSGICWHNLNTNQPVQKLLKDYRQRKMNQNRRPFFDGPHFELYKREYP